MADRMTLLARLRSVLLAPRPVSIPPTWAARIRRPNRFTLIEEDVSVEGTVQHAYLEEDGDWHVQLRVLKSSRPQFTSQANVKHQHGCLVVEIEPWQRGLDPTRESEVWMSALGPTMPLHGDYWIVEGALFSDDIHGWWEMHSPASVTRRERTRG